MTTVHPQHTPESWRPVEYYEGRYEVSDHGRVRSRLVDDEWKIKAQKMNPSGYMCVDLYHGGVPTTHRVHRMVALAFLPGGNTFGGPGNGDVMHLNHDRTDNRLANLAWGSRKQNIRHSAGEGRMSRGSKHYNSKLTEDQVRQIRADPRSRNEVAADYGVHPTAIELIVTRKNWRHVK